MSNYTLTATSAFPAPLKIGAYSIEECMTLGLVSVSARHGKSEVTRQALAALIGRPCDVSEFHEGRDYGVFWSGPDQWFVMDAHKEARDLEAQLAPIFASQASLSEQSDGWVGFDLRGPDCTLVLERLCNIDLATFPSGRVQRTVIAQIGAFVLCREGGCSYRLLCGRSYAVSFRHALETAVQTVSGL